MGQRNPPRLRSAGGQGRLPGARAEAEGLDVAYEWTKDELPALREMFAGWGMVEVNFDMVGERPEEMLAGFRHVMECLAPDVVGVPICTVDEGWTDDEITAFYWDMRKIGAEYARNMRWVDPA